MSTDLTAYHSSFSEQQRINDYFSLFQVSGNQALDIGDRDGYLNRLRELFPILNWEKATFVGTSTECNAGNPFGTWQQQESCVHSGSPFGTPRARSPVERLATRSKFLLNRLQALIDQPHGNWIRVLFSKPLANTKA